MASPLWKSACLIHSLNQQEQWIWGRGPSSAAQTLHNIGLTDANPVECSTPPTWYNCTRLDLHQRALRIPHAQRYSLNIYYYPYATALLDQTIPLHNSREAASDYHQINKKPKAMFMCRQMQREGWGIEMWSVGRAGADVMKINETCLRAETEPRLRKRRGSWGRERLGLLLKGLRSWWNNCERERSQGMEMVQKVQWWV